MLAIITTLGESIISVSTRKLKEINFAVIQFNYALLSTTTMAIIILVFFLKSGKIPFNYSSWWIYVEILIASICNMLAQSMKTISNQNASPATVSLMCYIGVPYNFVVDWLIFELDLNVMQVTGVIICLTSSIAGAIY